MPSLLDLFEIFCTSAPRFVPAPSSILPSQERLLRFFPLSERAASRFPAWTMPTALRRPPPPPGPSGPASAPGLETRSLRTASGALRDGCSPSRPLSSASPFQQHSSLQYLQWSISFLLIKTFFHSQFLLKQTPSFPLTSLLLESIGFLWTQLSSLKFLFPPCHQNDFSEVSNNAHVSNTWHFPSLSYLVF